MRKLTHKQFITFDPSVIPDPKTIEDLQDVIPVNKRDEINKEIYILRLCLLEILQLHCINVKDPIKKQIQDLNNWRKELINKGIGVDFPVYNTPEIFYSLKRDIVDAPTTDNTTKILDQPYINSIGGSGANDPTEEDAKTEFFYAINLRFHRLVAKLFSISELFLPKVLKDNNLAGGEPTLLLILMLVQFNINAKDRWKSKTNITGEKLDNVPYSFPWKLSSNPSVGYKWNLIEEILLKGMSNPNTSISGFEKSDLYNLFSFEQEHKLYKVQMPTTTNPNPEVFEITQEETKVYLIKESMNNGLKPTDPMYVDEWGKRNKREDQIIYGITNDIPHDVSKSDAYKYNSLNSNNKDINDIINNYVYSSEYSYNEFTEQSPVILLKKGNINTVTHTTNIKAVGKKANIDVNQNALDVPGGDTYQYDSRGLADVNKPKWENFKLVTFNKITRAPEKYFIVNPKVDKMKITEYLTINDGTENHYKLIAASVSAGDDHDNVVSTTCRVDHAVALVWVNGTAGNSGRWVEFNDNNDIPIFGSPSIDSNGNIDPTAKAFNDRYKKKFNGYSENYGKYLYNSITDMQKILQEENDSAGNKVYQLNNHFKLQSRKKGEELPGHLKWTGGAQTNVSLSKPWYFYKPPGIWNPYTRVMPRSYEKNGPIAFPDTGLNFESKKAIFLIYERVTTRGNENITFDTYPSIQSLPPGITHFNIGSGGIPVSTVPVPGPIAPVPNAPSPNAPVPNAPSPNALVPNAPSPIAPVPNVPGPNAPVPNAPSPNALVPNAPSPIAPVPNVPGPNAPVPNVPGVPGPGAIRISKSIDFKNIEQVLEISTLINYILIELKRFRIYMLESNFIRYLFISHGYQKHFKKNAMVYTKMNKGSKFFSDSIINFFFKIAGFNKLNKSYVRII
jgi:hypothetical protein